MKKGYKMIILAFISLILIFEILPYNALIITGNPVYDSSGVLHHIQMNKEYCSYFDISVLGRGNIFALPAGIFTALTFVLTLIYVLSGRKTVLKSAFAVNAAALAAELSQIMILGDNFLGSCATITGMLLLSLTWLLIFLSDNRSKEAKTIIKGENR